MTPLEVDRAIIELDRLGSELDLLDPRCNWYAAAWETTPQEAKAREIRKDLMHRINELEIRLGY